MSEHILELEAADGLRLRAAARGDPQAPAVLFLHGGGQTRHAWRGTAASLAAEGRHCVCVDLRGHGESDWAPDGSYRLERFVADLRVLLRHFQRPPALVGASLGGLVALLAAGESPGVEAAAIVLVDIAPRIERDGADRITAFMRQRPEGFASLEEAAEAVAAYTRNRSRPHNPESLARNLRRGPDDRWRWHWDPRFLSESGPAEIADAERLYRAAGRLSPPTLLVRGRESDILSEAGAAEFLSRMPAAEYVDVSGAGHMVAGDRNDAFTEAVRRFLHRIQPVAARKPSAELQP